MAKKTTINDFREQVALIAKSIGATYVSVGVETSIHLHPNNEPTTKYSCYIDGFSYTHGRTPDEAITEMKILTGILIPEKTDIEI